MKTKYNPLFSTMLFTMAFFAICRLAYAPPPPALSIELVAAKGDALDSNTLLGTAGPPAIDAAGNVAFHAIVNGAGPNSGIAKKNNERVLLYTGTVPTIVAASGAADIVTGATFTELGDPVLSGSGALAFLGELQPDTGNATSANASGVWVFQSGTTSLAVRAGDPAPGLGGASFTRFSSMAINNAGGVAVLAKLNDKSNSPALCASDQSGTLQLVTHKGDTFTLNGATVPVKRIKAFAPLPYVGGQSRTLDTAGGNVFALLKGPRGKMGFVGAILTGTGFSIAAEIQAQGVKSLGEPVGNSAGDVAFSAKLKGPGVTKANNTAVAIQLSGTQVALVLANTGFPAPDATGALSPAVFSKLRDPVLNNNGHIAFIGSLKTGGVTSADNGGIWSNVDGALKSILRKGDSAPGSSGTFSVFEQIVLPDVDGPIFLAKLNGVPKTENRGVWALTSTGLKPVIITGGQLDFHGVQKAVTKIGIFQTAPGVTGQSRSFDTSTDALVFQATFTDGTWGIYRVSFP